MACTVKLGGVDVECAQKVLGRYKVIRESYLCYHVDQTLDGAVVLPGFSLVPHNESASHNAVTTANELQMR